MSTPAAARLEVLVRGRAELLTCVQRNAPTLVAPTLAAMAPHVVDATTDAFARVTLARALAVAARDNLIACAVELARATDIRAYPNDPLPARLAFLDAADAARRPEHGGVIWALISRLIDEGERAGPRPSMYPASWSARRPSPVADARLHARRQQLVLDYYGTLRSPPDTLFDAETQARALADVVVATLPVAAPDNDAERCASPGARRAATADALSTLAEQRAADTPPTLPAAVRPPRRVVYIDDDDDDATPPLAPPCDEPPPPPTLRPMLSWLVYPPVVVRASAATTTTTTTPPRTASPPPLHAIADAAPASVDDDDDVLPMFRGISVSSSSPPPQAPPIAAAVAAAPSSPDVAPPLAIRHSTRVRAPVVRLSACSTCRAYHDADSAYPCVPPRRRRRVDDDV